MTPQQTKSVIKELERLGRGGEPLYFALGICTNILKICGVDCDEYEHLFRSWRHFSGNKFFPVPSLEKNKSALVKYCSEYNVWTGKYGAMRRKLCRFLARELRKTL